MFLKEFILRWATIFVPMLRLRIILNFSLELKLTLHSSIKQLLGLCKIDCQWTILEIDSINVFDGISVPLLFRCSFDPFAVIFLSCCIKKIFFSFNNSFKCRFVYTTFRWWPSLLTVIADNVTSKELLFTDRANSTTEFAICSSRWFLIYRLYQHELQGDVGWRSLAYI